MSRHRLLNVRTLLSLVAAIVLVVAVACGSSATATPKAPSTGSTSGTTSTSTTPSTPVPTAAMMDATQEPAMMGGDAKYGGDIRMSAYADTRDWDPLGSSSLSSIQAYSQLYNQLVQFDTGADTTKVVGDLADSWDITNGGSTFTFHLNKNAKWHDGEDISADDVVNAYSRYMNPENSIGRSGLFRNYTVPVADGGIKKIDADTVEMNLSFASGAFINFMALDYSKILPKHIMDKGVDLNQAEGIIENKSGSGPFMLDEYQRGNLYRVSKNPNYFKEGRPYFDSISHFIITDTGTLIAQFKAGQLDMMNGGFSNLSPTEYLQLDADTVGSSNGHIIANEMPGSRNWGLMINRKVGPLQDPKVRKAIYLTLDRAQLNDLLEDGTGDTPCALWGMGYSLEECATFPGIRDKNSDGGKADIAFAKQLMAEAGYANGFDTKYDARQVGSYPDTCSIIKQQLSDNLGINGDIGTHESAAGYTLFGTARAEGATGDWELACQGEGMTVLDPDALLGGVYLKGATRNYTDWEPQIVRDIFETQKVEQDAAKRRQQLKDLEDFLIPTNPADISKGFTDGHWVTLYWGKFFWLTHEDIRGFNPPATVQYSFKHEDLWIDR
ncbi:MAG: ABC transporter substrate-binding protein [SAR202 cluster bacterium]|nr:ABC transporter substrate-binding protein [SAR202 cluster bacterium]